MSARKTDFRALQHRRSLAMQRTELREDQKRVEPVSQEEIDAAIAAGRFRKLPAKKPTAKRK